MTKTIARLSDCKFVVEVSPTYLAEKGIELLFIQFFQNYNYSYTYGKSDAFQWEVFIKKSHFRTLYKIQSIRSIYTLT